MIRTGLLAIVFLSAPAYADTAPKLELPACDISGDANSCVRFLACVGNEGLWMDGQARGWNVGTIAAQRNDGPVCAGNWAAGTGPNGAGTAQYQCSDGSSGEVIYFAQDSSTGTVIARGVDNKGREIRAWSGEHVLKFLGDGDVNAAKLPCTDAPLLIG